MEEWDEGLKRDLIDPNTPPLFIRANPRSSVVHRPTLRRDHVHREVTAKYAGYVELKLAELENEHR
jgi:hypothetical protein